MSKKRAIDREIDKSAFKRSCSYVLEHFEDDNDKQIQSEMNNISIIYYKYAARAMTNKQDYAVMCELDEYFKTEVWPYVEQKSISD